MSQVSVSPSPRHSSYHHQLPANSSPTSTISDDDDLSNHSDSPNDLRTARKYFVWFGFVEIHQILLNDMIIINILRISVKKNIPCM